MNKLVALFAVVTLAACSPSTPNPAPAPDMNQAANAQSPDCGPKCQEHIENHKWVKNSCWHKDNESLYWVQQSESPMECW